MNKFSNKFCNCLYQLFYVKWLKIDPKSIIFAPFFTQKYVSPHDPSIWPNVQWRACFPDKYNKYVAYIAKFP